MSGMIGLRSDREARQAACACISVITRILSDHSLPPDVQRQAMDAVGRMFRVLGNDVEKGCPRDVVKNDQDLLAFEGPKTGR